MFTLGASLLHPSLGPIRLQKEGSSLSWWLYSLFFQGLHVKYVPIHKEHDKTSTISDLNLQANPWLKLRLRWGCYYVSKWKVMENILVSFVKTSWYPATPQLSPVLSICFLFPLPCSSLLGLWHWFIHTHCLLQFWLGQNDNLSFFLIVFGNMRNTFIVWTVPLVE